MPPINLQIDNRNRLLDLKLELDPAQANDRAILKSFESGQLYEPDVSNLILLLVEEGDVVVDVGANIGFFTALLGAVTGPTGCVLSFEPGENALAQLRHNIALNDLKQVRLIEQPASAAAGEVSFFINSDDSGGNALWDVATYPNNVKSAAAPQRRTLQATTVDLEIKKLRLAPPKLIKIDTEGAELEVLRGCRETLAAGKTPFVIAEYHPFGLEKMKATAKDLRAFMAGFGYETFGVFFDGAMPRLIPAGTEIGAPYIINLLFTTPEHVGRKWPSAYHDPGWSTLRPK